MNHTIGKTKAVYTATGIGIAAILAMAFSAVAGLAMGGETGAMLVKQFGDVLLCGIGYGAPAVVWTNDRLATWAKALIALVPGTLMYTAAAWWMGWIHGNTALPPWSGPSWPCSPAPPSSARSVGSCSAAMCAR